MIQFTDGLLDNETISFEMIVCCNCKVPFMITSSHRDKLLKSGEWFYCPNGHSQHYSESECQRTKKEFEAKIRIEKERVEALEKWNSQLLNQREELRYQVRESKKTKCPHCQKRYINIAQHIKKHHSK